MAAPKRINWDAQPLGNMSDGSIARNVGVSPSVVSRARIGRGIKPFPQNYIHWDSQPLGKIADTVLARKFGVTVRAVVCARASRGIPAYNMGNKVICICGKEFTKLKPNHRHCSSMCRAAAQDAGTALEEVIATLRRLQRLTKGKEK